MSKTTEQLLIDQFAGLRSNNARVRGQAASEVLGLLQEKYGVFNQSEQTKVYEMLEAMANPTAGRVHGVWQSTGIDKEEGQALIDRIRKRLDDDGKIDAKEAAELLKGSGIEKMATDTDYPTSGLGGGYVRGYINIR